MSWERARHRCSRPSGTVSTVTVTTKIAGEKIALLALIRTALAFVSCVTLQYRVPLKVGSVLGRYSEPRWVLKSCTTTH